MSAALTPLAVANTGAEVGAPLKAVMLVEVDAEIPEIPIRAALVPAAVANTGAEVGAALKAVMAADPLAVSAEAARSAVEVPDIATSTEATAGAAENAVIAADALELKAEIPRRAAFAPLAVANTGALVGVALNAVMLVEAVANEDAAESVADVRAVAAAKGTDWTACCPIRDTVQDVDAPANARRCPTTTSPDCKLLAAKVKGLTLYPDQATCDWLYDWPACVAEPDPHVLDPLKLITLASEVEFPKE